MPGADPNISRAPDGRVATALSMAHAGDRTRWLGETLAAGGLVALPTETVYGVFASAAGDGLARFESALLAGNATDDAARLGTRPHTWHAPDVRAVLSLVDIHAAAARRLLTALLPGPVRFAIELDEPTLARVRGVLGVEPGVIDDGSTLLVRVPETGLSRGVLAAASEADCLAVVACRLSAMPWWTGGDAAPSRAMLDEIVEAGRVSAAVDGGPCEHGGPSTLVRLSPRGAFAIVTEGVVPEAGVMAALERKILFVCTGNTCRSPMAEALARAVLAGRTEDGQTVTVASAGVAAADGMPASSEAVEVLGERGIALESHRSRRLTAKMVAEAEAIFTMTPSHLAAVLDLDPSAAARATVLDPSGDVPDPIGGPIEVYRETAERIAALVRTRLREMELV